MRLRTGDASYRGLLAMLAIGAFCSVALVKSLPCVRKASTAAALPPCRSVCLCSVAFAPAEGAAAAARWPITATDYPSTGQVWQTLNSGKSPGVPNNLIISGAAHGQISEHCSGAVLRYRQTPRLLLALQRRDTITKHQFALHTARSEVPAGGAPSSTGSQSRAC